MANYHGIFGGLSPPPHPKPFQGKSIAMKSGWGFELEFSAPVEQGWIVEAFGGLTSRMVSHSAPPEIGQSTSPPGDDKSLQ